VEVQWHMPITFRVVFAEDYFVRLEERVQGRWRPLQHYGQDFDDRSEDIAIIQHTELFTGLAGKPPGLSSCSCPGSPLPRAHCACGWPRGHNFKASRCQYPEACSVDRCSHQRLALQG
jgi:hypothetical protein